MATTVESGFTTFHGRLTPSGTETDAAKGHRMSIAAALRARFAISSFFRTGSFGHGTSVRGYSDVDYFAVVPATFLRQNSDTILTNMRDTLDRRFPRTGVGIRTPAVRVPFGTNGSESTEVIPAVLTAKTGSGHNIYDIPNRHGNWMRSSPGAHNAYVDGVDRKLGGKVKPLIRFAKAWRNYRNAPIRSFYLELRVAKYAAGETTIVYGADLRGFFKYLADTGIAGMQDPVGVSGTIHPASTPVQIADAFSKLETALGRADKACAAAASGNVKNAFEWWNLVFDGHFPAYG